MDYNSAQFILSALGREIIEYISCLECDTLELGKKLRKKFETIPPSFLSAAVELSIARKKGQTKFSRAGEMFFTRETLEQSSGEIIAGHCAERFSGKERTLDACCGIGGDSIALGKVVKNLTCMDLSPVHLAFCDANLRMHGIEAVMLEGDIVKMKESLHGYDSIFIDPSRRSDNKRTFDPSRMSPPLDEAIDILGRVPCGAAKLPASVSSANIPVSHELEWISTADGLKEAVMWTGDFIRAKTSVTLLHKNAFIDDSMFPEEEPEVSKAGNYLYEPDPALIRSGLLGRKGASLGMNLINIEIAYMSSEEYIPDPFFTAYRIINTFEFNLKTLEKELRAMNAGNLTVKKRGFPMLPEELAGKIKLYGDVPVTIAVTRELEKRKVFIIERIQPE